ncbi:hypothetical protein [Ornithinibacillus sp. JPR2-1]|uniref:hypothetical protein n=1 Tax=Ornithinibacillus sp. JPR2-1 TaxID=2094019 RepID=UPI0031D19638
MEKIWKVTETLIKVIDEEQNHERKLRLIGVVKELKSIHQSCMDELVEAIE